MSTAQTHHSEASELSEHSVRDTEIRVTPAHQVGPRHGWPQVTDAQRAQDIQIRLLQAEARRLADDAFREAGRWWVSDCRLHQREASTEIAMFALPVPPVFEEVIGYVNEARYVAAWLETDGECYLSDGRTLTIGYIDAFYTFTCHHAVAPALHGYHLGSVSREATHCLVLDRHCRQFALASRDGAKRLIQSQWKPVPVEEVHIGDQGAWAVLKQEIEAQMSQISPDLVAQEIQHQRLVQELITWLERAGAEAW